MKKIFLAIYLILIFSTTTVNAYTVFVGIDNSIVLSSVVGFQFDVSVPLDSLDPPTIYYQGDTVGLCEGSGVGAVPGALTGPWSVGPTTSNGGYVGNDQFWGSFNPSPGIILSLTSPGNTPFSLVNFQLITKNSVAGIVWNNSNFIETSLEGCKEYTYSVVPIPGSLVLLGSGLIGLIGLGRRRMRK